MIVENRRSTFSKEILTALLILTTCLMLHLHLLVDEKPSTFYLLGREFHHGYVSNQAYVWYSLYYLQVLVYTTLCFYFCKRRFKYALLALIYWMIYGMIADLYPKSYGTNKLVLQSFGMFITVVFIGGIIITKINRQKSYDYIFKFNKYKYDVVITVLLVFLPFLERVIYRMPDNLQEIDLSVVSVTSNGFPNLSTFFFYLLLKLFVIAPTSLLFFGIRKWWRYALLVPILMAVFQIKTAFNSDSEDIDTYEIFEAAPLLIIVLALLLFLSNTAYYQAKMQELYRKTYDHVEQAIQIRFGGRECFLSQTKTKWQEMKKSDDLNEDELYQLKQRLEQELQKHGS